MENRREIAQRLRSEKKTWVEIGAVLEITPARARQLGSPRRVPVTRTEAWNQGYIEHCIAFLEKHGYQVMPLDH